ncbi:tRNA(Ile)-lysidine synthetase [Pedobacter sp. BAL39]|uniref:tRNA lysidine(34) synthetase TilS n=1 Tax=Pedobacter sp. BAL39 TaxID=391596 RepID=UPI000155B06F|nr:tRNA lysidine(34) synthetase TilS [Pedobacter sp. BAL39]EDM34382.1 tRNA(Ile)-lysidine synthetase [Pedobacter sp. BAL39]
MLPLQQFKTFITENHLFETGDKILLAVSGGKDSVLMAHLFKASGHPFGIAHCNFNLRGEESVRDEHFVKMLGLMLDVPVYVTHFDTKAYAKQHGVSTQMAARTLRYEWFEQLRIERGYQVIALAQHQDDAMETVLLNLTRGTGISGLHGIFPRRGNLIRPLMFLSRQEIDDLVVAHHLDFVEDSSNLSSNYIRNKIRLKVIPLLREINPGLALTFSENIRRFSDTEQVLRQVVQEHHERLFVQRNNAFYLPIVALKKLDPARLLLFELLQPYGFVETVVADLLRVIMDEHPRVGAVFYSRKYQLAVDREHLIMTVKEDATENKHMLIHLQDKMVAFRGNELYFSHHERSEFKDGIPFDKGHGKIFVATDKLIFPLVIRSWQKGDRFRPLGMKGFKKLSDLFVDEKVPLLQKQDIPVLVNGNGELIWVAGYRQDDRYRVSDATLRLSIFQCRSLQITYTQQS